MTRLLLICIIACCRCPDDDNADNSMDHDEGDNIMDHDDSENILDLEVEDG